ncbi:hypothetical protein T439DRAFT_323958 [Meredithblackwellia eburnea MCA 4105]
MFICVLVTLKTLHHPKHPTTLNLKQSSNPWAPLPLRHKQQLQQHHHPSTTKNSMPNFDFDLVRVNPEQQEPQTDDELEPDDPEDEDQDPIEQDTDDDDHLIRIPHSHSSQFTTSHKSPTPFIQPFLPFSCDAPCAATTSLSSNRQARQPPPPPPTCSKYSPTGPNNTYDPLLLERSVMFRGTGTEVRRVLHRAVKSHLYGLRRRAEGAHNTQTDAFEDELSFRVLVLGGSVSNCRGVEPWTECWHSRIRDWMYHTLPLEGDPKPKIDVAPPPQGPSRLDNEGSGKINLVRRASSPSPPSGDGGEVNRVKRQAGNISSKVAKRKGASRRRGKKKEPTAPGGRKRPISQVINAAKSATGSAYYAYCFDAEMDTRGKRRSWGPGPDLVVLEFGVNDVWPLTDVATRDFERLIVHLRSLPSRPGIVILEAASLLLAQTAPGPTSTAEYLHLAPAHFHDIPILSTKQALFGPSSPFLPRSGLDIHDLFLEDTHHFNARGHELLSDVLQAYLEREACEVQAQLIKRARERVSNAIATAANSHSDDSAVGGGGQRASFVVEPTLDFGWRKDEKVLPLPERSLFASPHPLQQQEDSGDGGAGAATNGAQQQRLAFPKPTCLQVGNSKTNIVPRENNGWTKYSWARDKQYLTADVPGSKVTFDVSVGPGGEVLVDWLQSRAYDLGDVLVYLDGDRASGVKLAGWWDLGWSIGVPTIVFKDVVAGAHELSIELLPAEESSHPDKKTSFRLIGIITS